MIVTNNAEIMKVQAHCLSNVWVIFKTVRWGMVNAMVLVKMCLKKLRFGFSEPYF